MKLIVWIYGDESFSSMETSAKDGDDLMLFLS